MLDTDTWIRTVFMSHLWYESVSCLPLIDFIIDEPELQEASRIIFRCKLSGCGHVWAHNYERDTRGLFRTWVPEAVDINQQPFSTPEQDKRCPKCHHLNVAFNQVVGTVVSTRPCDERCMGATGHVCNCSCGGKNHGKGHLL